MKKNQDFLDLLSDHEAILQKVSRMYTEVRTDREDLRQEIIYQLWKAWPGSSLPPPSTTASGNGISGSWRVRWRSWRGELPNPHCIDGCAPKIPFPKPSLS